MFKLPELSARSTIDKLFLKFPSTQRTSSKENLMTPVSSAPVTMRRRKNGSIVSSDQVWCQNFLTLSDSGRDRSFLYAPL